MSVTLKKIAELAGVSIGTVDRALNGRKGVNKDVAIRIIEIADSLGYRPNRAAKALVARKRAFKIGVIFHAQKHAFFEEVIKGVNAAAEEVRDFGVQVIIKYGINFDVDNQLQLIDELLSEGVNAIALIPINDPRIVVRLNQLNDENFPVALFVSEAENASQLVYVGCDAFSVGRISAGAMGLITNGNANILYVTPPLGILGNSQRLLGFQTTLNRVIQI